MTKKCRQGHEQTPENVFIDRGRNQCHLCRLAQRKRWYLRHRERICVKNKAHHRLRSQDRTKIKIEVLSHYGKLGKLQCVWDGCNIIDVDMLTIDHINNDGHKDRAIKGYRFKGYQMYNNLKKAGYPSNLHLQTLCANHQLKKEMIRKRELVSSAARE